MTEDQLEQETLGWLAEVGYTPLFGRDLSPDKPGQERGDHRRLRSVIATLRDTLLPRLISGQLRLPENRTQLEGVLP